MVKARTLVDRLNDPDPVSTGEDEDKAGEVQARDFSRKGVKRALEDAILADKSVEQVADLHVANVLLRALTALATAKSQLAKLAATDRQQLIKILRSRNQEPPEGVAALLEDLEGNIGEFSDVIDAAIAPDPLPKIQGKPPFRFYIQRQCQLPAFDNNQDRFAIATSLASHTDQGKIVTVSDLARALSLPITTVTGQLGRLRLELLTRGIALDTHVKREKDSRGSWDKKDAYRLKWYGQLGTAGSFSEAHDFLATINAGAKGGFAILAKARAHVLTRAHPNFATLSAKEHLRPGESLIQIAGGPVQKVPNGILDVI
ncbi:MAG: hypothetical protein HY817_04060 [Candidatus Abawacabacteria bacterium]|nr:hypothetical protein [Candidatus Abawacabacteria bacterium]